MLPNTTMSAEPIDEDSEDPDVNDILEYCSGSPSINAGAGERHPFLMSPVQNLMLRTHLAPLTVMNRTPLPSDEGRESRSVAEADGNEEQEQERDQDGMRKEASPNMPRCLCMDLRCYGTETDLSGSLGPIPIVFSIDPLSSMIPGMQL